MRSLSVLVRAAVADLVRDACIGGRPGMRLDAIADHAGCGLAEEPDSALVLEKALRAVRDDNVFVLTAGYAPTSGFNDEMADWLLEARPPAGALRREPETFIQRLFPGLAPIVGVVARKQDCLDVRARDARTLGRALGARTLRTRARKVV